MCSAGSLSKISVARIEPILRESEISKTLLAGFFPIRYSAGAQAIRQAARAGRFGTLSFLSARVKWWRKDSYYRESNWRGRWDLDGGGALMNQGIHAVDLLQWIGGRTSRVTAVAKTLVHKGIQVEDTLAATVEFAGGAVGTIEAATSCYPGLDLSLEVSGSAGNSHSRSRPDRILGIRRGKARRSEDVRRPVGARGRRGR